jgi:hypothetical protein
MINGGVRLLTISVWGFKHYGFPLYLFLAGLILIILIRFKLGRYLNT